MILRAKNERFNLKLKEYLGWMHGKEVATLTLEQMRAAQSKVDICWVSMAPCETPAIAKEYVNLKSNINRQLQARGGFKKS